MKTFNFKSFYQGFLVLIALFCFSFNLKASDNDLGKMNSFKTQSHQVNKKSLVYNFNSLQELNSFDFEKLDELNESDFVDCTVSATVSAYGVSVTFSVTAPTCAQAGAGAASAVKAFIREMK